MYDLVWFVACYAHRISTDTISDSTSELHDTVNRPMEDAARTDPMSTSSQAPDTTAEVMDPLPSCETSEHHQPSKTDIMPTWSATSSLLIQTERHGFFVIQNEYRDSGSTSKKTPN